MGDKWLNASQAFSLTWLNYCWQVGTIECCQGVKPLFLDLDLKLVIGDSVSQDYQKQWLQEGSDQEK